MSLFSLKLSPKSTKKVQDDLIQNVSDEITLSRSYALLLTFSSLIATLGLLTNSAAVVIGAMLISPLFWPVIGLSLSVVTTRRNLLKRSGSLFTVSLLIVLIVAFITAKLTPTTGVSAEILARTNPTLIDLFIALASSVIGVMAISIPRISQSATGVALSIALLPALCVTGIGLALADPDITTGSALLFAANIAAIIFAGVITLYFLNFRPKRESEQTRFELGLLLASILIIGLAIPLGVYLFDGLAYADLTRQINQTLRQEAKSISDSATIEDVQIRTSPNNQELHVQATILLPEGVYLTTSRQQAIIDNLQILSGQTVNLQLNLVNTVKLRLEEDETISQLKSEIINFTTQKFSEYSPTEFIDSLSVQFSDSADTNQGATINMVLKQYQTPPLTFEQKITLENQLSSQFNFPISLAIELIPTQKLEDHSYNSFLTATTRQVIIDYISTISPQLSIDNLLVDSVLTSGSQLPESLTIDLTLHAPQTLNLTSIQVNQLRSQIQQATGAYIQLNLKIIEYQTPT